MLIRCAHLKNVLRYVCMFLCVFFSIAANGEGEKKNNTIDGKEEKKVWDVKDEIEKAKIRPLMISAGTASLPDPSAVFANDPIRFDISTSNASPKVGEEFDIILTAELLNVTPALMFFLEESKRFSIKVTMPEGFVQTGGNYADFVGTALNKGGTEQVKYTLKGKFVSEPTKEACFQLLRGPRFSDAATTFIYKGQQCVNVTRDREENSAARVEAIQSGTECTSFAQDVRNWTRYQGTPIIAVGYNLRLTDNSTHTACLEIIGSTLSSCISGGDYVAPLSGVVEVTVPRPDTYQYRFELTTPQPGCSLYTLPGSTTITATDFTPVISYSGSPCGENTVSLNVTGCGSGSVIWYRNGGGLIGNATSRNVSDGGTYTAKCSFGIDGTSNLSQPVTIYSKPTLNLTMTPVSEDNWEKKFNLSLSGCNGSITWSTGAGNSASTSVTVEKSCFGGPRPYTAQCIQNGCSYEVSTTVEVNASVLDNTPVITDAGCANNQGSIVFSGPNKDKYEYYWRYAAPYTNANPKNATNLPAGTYSIVFTTNAAICPYYADFVVLGATPPNVNAGGDKVINCTNSSVTLNGTSSTPNVTYKWQTPNGTVNGQNLTNVTTPGDYTLIVTSSQGCTASSNIKVKDERSYPNATVTWPAEAKCKPFQVTAINHSDATYTWERNGGSISNSQAISITDGGNYKLKIRYNGNGCESSSSSPFITEYKSVSANAGPAKTITCRDAERVQLEGSSSHGSPTYYWTALEVGGAFLNESQRTAAMPTVIAPGNYKLTVKNEENGCTADAFVQVSQNKDLPSVSLSGGQLSCNNGNQVTLTASSQQSVSWGNWTGPGTGGATGSTFTATAPGEFTVKATRIDNGCSKIANSSVAPSAGSPSINMGTGPKVCNGAPVTLSPSVSGGAGGYTYQWSPATGLSSTNILNPTANLGTNESMTYSLKVIGANGCDNTGNVTVTNTMLSAPSVTASPTSICPGGQTTLTVSGDLGDLDWGTTTQDIGISSTRSIVVTPSQTTTYWFAIKRNVCQSNRTLKEVVVNPVPAEPTLGANKTNLCAGETTTLSGTCSTSGSTLQWINVGSSTNVTPSATTTYEARCLSDKGCQSSVAQIQINVTRIPDAPAINTNFNTVCSGDAVTLSTPTSCPGGTIKWSNNSTGSSIVINPTATASYTAVCQINNCQSPASNSVLVSVNPRPSAPSVSNPTSYCLNSPASSLPNTGGSSLKWYTAATGGSGLTTAPVPSTGTVGVVSYYVSQTSAYGCEGPRAKIDVTTRALPDTLSALTKLVQHCQNSTPVSLKPVGTVSGIKSLWYTAATGGTALDSIVPSTNVVGTQTYYYSRRELTYSCESLRRKVTVRVNTIPGAPAVTAINICKNSPASPLTATPSSGGTIKWYTALTGGTALSSSPVPSTTTAGTTNYYASQVVNGCESTRATLAVTVRETLAPTVTNANVNYCRNATASQLTAAGTNLVWYLPGSNVGISTAPIPSTTDGGTFIYQVSQIGAYSCESAKTAITVTINVAPSAPTTTSPIFKCQGETAQNLTAGGESIKWYTGVTGGSPLPNPVKPNLNIPGTTTYYASQTNDKGCESPTRAALTVTVYQTPTVATPSSKTLCVSQPFSQMALASSPSGATCDWRVTNQSIATALGMTVFSGTNTIPAFTTQNTQSVPVTVVFELTPKGNGCEGAKTTFSLTVSPKPSTPVITASNLFICPADTVYLTATNVDAGALLRWSTGQSGLDSIRVIPIENSVYKAYATKDGCTGDTAVSDTIYVSRLELQSKPTIDCDPETRTGAISASVLNANANWITTFKLERLIGGYGELMSDSLSENWIAGNLGANGVTYSGLKNGIYRILARQLPADLPPDQAGRDFCITYSDTVTVQCQKFRKERVRSERCGDMSPLDLSNQAYLYKLMPGDTIWAGDFDVIIVEAQKIGTNGTFSGKGYVKMPKLFNAQVAVTFENAVFNDDFELIQGKIDAVYDPSWEGIGDVNQFIKDAKVLANTVADAVTYAVDALITTSAKRIESIAEELVRNAKENLPDDLRERVIAAAEEYKAAKAAYDNATTEAERNAAKASFEAAKDKLEAIKNETEQFLDDFQNIIILSLESIQQEKNTGELNRLKDNVASAAQALNLPTTPEPQFSESMTNLIFIEGEEVVSVRNTQEQAYYDAQKAYHKAQIASIFASKMKNAKGAKQVGETLKREGTKLSTYIYEAKKQQVAESAIVLEVKSIIYSALEKTLKIQVYEK